jgi:dTDP-3-amino-3,4,6-trideoxy-alpha-D-glucose transaminase
MSADRVAFLDLAAAHRELRAPIDAAIARVLERGGFVLGHEVDAFESEWAEFAQATHAVTVGNGLDALTLGLRALGIGPGDDVLVPATTFIATWLAVSAVGARPVPVEPSPGTWNLDPARLAAALTSRTRAVLPVHLYGQPADLDPILAFARSHGLRVLEDAAQAHGARYRGRRIGAHADAVAWSFYPAKNLGALGDGGAVTTNDATVANAIRELRNYGGRAKYDHRVRGVNSRLDEVQAAVLRVKLRVLDAWNDRRAAIARIYLERLRDVPDLALPSVLTGTDPVWHLFVVDHPERDRMRTFLADRGVETSIHYPSPPHLTPAYADLALLPGSLPLSETASRTHLSLPMGPHLNPRTAERVADLVKSACS